MNEENSVTRNNQTNSFFEMSPVCEYFAGQANGHSLSLPHRDWQPGTQGRYSWIPDTCGSSRVSGQSDGDKSPHLSLTKKMPLAENESRCKHTEAHGEPSDTAQRISIQFVRHYYQLNIMKSLYGVGKVFAGGPKTYLSLFRSWETWILQACDMVGCEIVKILVCCYLSCILFCISCVTQEENNTNGKSITFFLWWNHYQMQPCDYAEVRCSGMVSNIDISYIWRARGQVAGSNKQTFFLVLFMWFS